MANEKKQQLEPLNLYKRLRAYVHAPNSMGNNAFPLYKRVDMEATDSDTGEDASWLVNAEKDPEWLNKIDGTYGSPRNIRRLFIGANVCVVHFWEPIFVSGKQETSRIYTKTSKKDLTYNKEFVTTGQNEKYIIGNHKVGLSCLTDWSLRNLEEVYFDWPAIYSKRLKWPDNNGIIEVDSSAVINQFYSMPNNLIMKSNEIKQLFIEYCCRTHTLEKDYPRLKAVAFISDLDDVLKKVSTAYTGKGKETLDALQLNWLDEVKKTYPDVFQGKAIIGFYGENADINKLSEKFYSSPNLYVFDKSLQERFRRMSSEIDKLKKEIAAANKAVKTEEAPEETKKNKKETDFEVALNEYVNSMAKVYGSGLGDVVEGPSLQAYSYILDILVEAYGDEDILKEFVKFTDAGKERYYEASKEKLNLPDLKNKQ